MINAKNKWLGLVFLIVLLSSGWVMKALKEDTPSMQVLTINGQAQGTTYHIKYLDAEGRSFKQSIDSVFTSFDQAFSTYQAASEINALNKVETHRFSSAYFFPVLEKSLEVYRATGGAFDPTIAPLVKAWGFGPQGLEEIPADRTVDSLRQLVGFDRLTFTETELKKHHKNMQLDLNAIAPGYTVDVLAAFLQAKGVHNFFIELGGEVQARGANEQGDPWRLGINTPSEEVNEQMDIKLILQVKDRAVTTSGNYRRFYEQEGVKYSHTISPFTGKPVRHTLLSATVVAPDCITADAYATAFMVLGLHKTIEIVEKQQELAVLLIYSNAGGGLETYTSPSLLPYLLKNDISKR